MPASSVPFYVIGVGRSGTTLLRLMLDGHSRLAVPGEAPWVTSVGLAAGARPMKELLEEIITHSRFHEWGLDESSARTAAARRSPKTWPALVDALFSAFAEKQSKNRWGDKTPTHIDHLPVLARWFPSAQFVHIVRDGRAVAASLAEQAWGPRNPMSASFYWRGAVQRARRYGARLGPTRYLEVRLEDLIDDTQAGLERICEFLEEPFETAMLDYPVRVAATNKPIAPPHAALALPPTPGLRDWRHEMTPLAQRAVESVCRPALKRFGYAVARSSATGLIVAWADRVYGATRKLARR